MWPYFILFLLVAVPALLESETNIHHSVRMVMYFGIGLLLTCFIGLRQEVGGDWQAYLKYLDSTRGKPIEIMFTLREPGYMLLNWIGANIFGGIYTVNTLGALILIAGVIVFCQTLPRPFIGLLVAFPYLLIVVGMGYTRQSIAIGMSMLAISCIHREKHLESMIWGAVAMMFHQSAVVFFLILPFSFLKNIKLLILMFIPLICLICWHLYEYIQYFIDGYGVGSKFNFQSSGVEIRLLMILLPCIAFLLLRKDFNLKASVLNFWIGMSLAAFGLMIFLVYFPGLSTPVDRVLLYWIPLQIMVYSHLQSFVNLGRHVQRWIFWGTLVYSGAIMLVFLNFSPNSFAWIPYQIHWW